ncbi:MAG: hypothetical protein AB7O24_00705 [Kofleriaceae bacterium]
MPTRSVTLGDLDRVPPALRYQLQQLGPARVLERGASWFGSAPSLAELGHAMIANDQPVEVRARGCAWLALFPSADMARRLAKLAIDRSTPRPVREQAIAALGHRQVRALHPETVWPSDAIAIADEALAQVADESTQAGSVTLDRLVEALRHVRSELVAAIFAKAPTLWSDAIESFATPPLARVLVVSIDDIPPRSRIRVLRLIVATLGDEALPLLVSRLAGTSVEERLETLQLAVTAGGERYLGILEDSVRGMRSIELIRRRAKWHLANAGVVPTVRGLSIARVTATLPVTARAERCGEAADDLAALARFERYRERSLYELWAWMVRGAADPIRASELIAAHPGSMPIVGELYLSDLARRGTVDALITAATELGAFDLGALQLAIWGRPLAALELATAAKVQTPELACARSLACYRAGRPDLAVRILDEDLPPAEITGESYAGFPGRHERWMAQHAPLDRPAIAALSNGLAGVLALIRPVPDDAEPDRRAFEPVLAVEQRLRRTVAASTVYVAGDVDDPLQLAAAIERAGARQVSGPLPGTDFYILGSGCSAELIGQLERQGARRIGVHELGAP